MATPGTSITGQELPPPKSDVGSIVTTNSEQQDAAQDDFLEQMISIPSWGKHTADRSPFSSSHKFFPTFHLHNGTSSDPNTDNASPDDRVQVYDYGSPDSAALSTHQHANGSGRPSPSRLLKGDLVIGRGCTSPLASCISDAKGVPLQMSLGLAGPPESSLHPLLLNVDVQGLYNGFHTSKTGGNGSAPQSFQNYGVQNVVMKQTSSSSGGTPQSASRPRMRARRGQATDPHSIAERLRRERIAERMKALQELVPNANKTDKASMLDEIIEYVKFLQLQVKVLSMSRLGAAAAVAPFVADISSAGVSGSMGRRNVSNCFGHDQEATGAGKAPATHDNPSMAENQVAKLMEEDMGSAMQYLQGKGLCLMPISLASAISTATSSHTNNNVATAGNSNKASSGNGISPPIVPSHMGNDSCSDGDEDTPQDHKTTRP